MDVYKPVREKSISQYEVNNEKQFTAPNISSLSQQDSKDIVHNTEESNSQKTTEEMSDNQRRTYNRNSIRFGGDLGTPTVKTINDPFGSIAQFFEVIRYRAKNHHNSQNLPHRLCDELSVEQVKQAVELVTILIEKEASLVGKKATGIEDIIKCLKESLTCQNKRDIYKSLIRTYTSESFLYSHLNRLLRIEAWDDMDNILPYITLLLFASYKLMPIGFENFQVFRGVILDKDMIISYNPGTYFSWNGFTSTSRKENIAKDLFVNLATLPQGSVRVLFIIDIHWLAGRGQIFPLAQYSTNPEEDEVLILPGTIYESLDINPKDGIYHIHVRVLNMKNIDKQVLRLNADRIISFQHLQDNLKRYPSHIVLNNLRDEDIGQAMSLLDTRKDFIEEVSIKDWQLSSIGIAKLINGLCLLPQLYTFQLKILRTYTPNDRSSKAAETFARCLPQMRINTLKLCIYKSNLPKEILFHNSFKNLIALSIAFASSMYYKENRLFCELLFQEISKSFISELHIDKLFLFQLGKLEQKVHECLLKSNVQKLLLTNVHPEKVASLRCIKGTKITHLYISGPLNDRIIRKIGEILYSLSLLQTLYLDGSSQNYLDQGFWDPPFDSLNGISDRGLTIFGKVLSRSTITNLRIKHLRLIDYNWLNFFNMLPETNIRSLYLYVEFDTEDDSLKDLIAPILPKTKIKELEIYEVDSFLASTTIQKSLLSNDFKLQNYLSEFNSEIESADFTDEDTE